MDRREFFKTARKNYSASKNSGNNSRNMFAGLDPMLVAGLSMK